jgi:Sulfotransferase family
MRLLNRVPYTMFGGETKSLFFELKRLYDFRENFVAGYPLAVRGLEVMKSEQKFPPHLLQGTEEQWRDVMRSVLQAWAGVKPDTRFWGWKEVHLCRYDAGVEIMSWVAELVPDAKFIWLMRDPQEVVESMQRSPNWWRQHFGKPHNFWSSIRAQRENLRKFQELYPDRVWMLDYADLTRPHFCDLLLENMGMILDPESWQEEINLVLR